MRGSVRSEYTDEFDRARSFALDNGAEDVCCSKIISGYHWNSYFVESTSRRSTNSLVMVENDNGAFPVRLALICTVNGRHVFLVNRFRVLTAGRKLSLALRKRGFDELADCLESTFNVCYVRKLKEVLPDYVFVDYSRVNGYFTKVEFGSHTYCVRVSSGRFCV